MRDPSEAPVPGARRTATWRRYLRFWGPRAAADVDDELAFHVDMRVRDYVARGMPEPEARVAAAERLGDLTTARDACVAISTQKERRMARAQIVDAFVQDVVFALRTLGRQKAWTAVVVLTLALGIGANTAVFSVVSSLLLHPLPYPHADRVAVVYLEPAQGNQTGMRVMISIRPALLAGWRASAHSFEDIEGYDTADLVFRAPDATPVSLRAAYVLPTFARFAGQRPLLGRGISPADIDSHANVAVLGESLWRSTFGADTGVVGRAIDLGNKVYTIVGVMPATLRLPRLLQDDTDIWLPLDLRDQTLGLSAVARLSPGVGIDAATRELDSVSAHVNAVEGATAVRSFRTNLTLPSHLVNFRQSLLMLSGAVALVLLIACANVAHLLLARTTGRQRELAIRAALGAGRGRIFRQLVTESVVLSAAGCAGGLLAGWAGLRVLVSMRPSSLAELGSARLDGATLLLTIAVAVVTGVAFGVVGMVQASHLSTHDALKAGALSASGGRRQGRAHSLLVVSEMALSMVLLVGAALLVRSVVHLQTMNPGFMAEGLYGVRLPMGHGDKEAAARAPRVLELLERVRKIPGVEGATLTTAPPPSMAFMVGSLEVEGYPPPAKGSTSFLVFNAVLPDYFAVARMPFVRGRTFTDTTAASTEIIVNDGFARKYWPGASALGHRVRVLQIDGSGDWKTIVGVAPNAFIGGLTSEASTPMLYLPHLEFTESLHPALLVRVQPGGNALPAIRKLAASLDPSIPPPTVNSAAAAMSRSAARPRFTMLLLTVFTLCAVVLAAVGLYGVMAYTVARRTREIGIRLALGASPRTIARSLIGEGMLLAAVGSALGVTCALWGTRLIEKMLYGVPRTDPLSFVAGAALLLFIALVACLVPTRRALGVDPLIAMRVE